MSGITSQKIPSLIVCTSSWIHCFVEFSQKIRQTTPKYRGGHENRENESSKFVKRRQDIANLSLRGNDRPQAMCLWNYKPICV